MVGHGCQIEGAVGPDEGSGGRGGGMESWPDEGRDGEREGGEAAVHMFWSAGGGDHLCGFSVIQGTFRFVAFISDCRF